MRNNSTTQKGKKFQLHIIDQSFEHNGMGIGYTQKSWKALKNKRRCTLHASIVSEGFANFIPKEDRPANSLDLNPLRDHLDYRRGDDIERSIPQNTGRAKTVTTASPGKMRLWTRFGSSYILYLTA